MSESERAAGSDSASGSKTPSKLPGWAAWPLRAVSVLAGLAVAAALFLVTDMGGMISMAGWYRLAPGQPWDLFWTLPALVYALSVRAGRAGA